MVKLSAAMTRSLINVTFVAIIVSIGGCGGGGGGGGGSDGNSQPAGVNVVMTNDSAGVIKQGQFNAEDGYLSRSGKVLVSQSGAASATFSLNIDRVGFYKVFVWGSHVSTAAGDIADVTIRHARGENTLIVDQKKRLGQWGLLGVYEFDPATKNEIQIASRAGGSLTVDAVRFEFIGTTAPALQFEINSAPGGEDAIPNLASAEIGEFYNENITVIGGAPPYQFTIPSGALPAGLEFDNNSGRIFGTPTVLGSSEFTLEVTDSVGTPLSAAMEISVVEQAPPIIFQPVVPEGKAQPADGGPVGAGPNLDNLKTLLSGIPEGSWIKVNLNSFSTVWTPPERRPLASLSNPTPSKLISAWSSAAWDPNLGDLWIFGGGHANYSGNDVYRWRGSTRMWERASLPSEVNQDDRGTWKAIDGQDNAPSAAHTYDNNMFLPIINRFLVFGGAAWNNGGAWMRQVSATTSRRTGPYLFDPTKADANKVGGSTGSHVKRVNPYLETVGGAMWQNRDIYVNISPMPPLPGQHVNGCTGYAVEGGKDVVYFAANPAGAQLVLYRYVINDVNASALDTVQIVGRYVSSINDDQPTCAYDPGQNIFLKKRKYETTSTGAVRPAFDYWVPNAATPGGQNLFMPTDDTGEFLTLLPAGAPGGISLRNCGMDFDSERRQFGMWCRDGRVWMIKAPATLSTSGWKIARQVAPVGATPLDTDSQGGVLGKFKYIPNVDAFLALHGINDGNVWLYKPVGWKFGGTPPPPPTEIIVDNAPAGGTDGSRTFTGAWCTSAGTSQFGVDSLYSCGEAFSTYTWKPSLPVAGDHDVYVRWTVFGIRSSTVPISVTSLAGSTTRNFDQTTGGGAWVLHGRYNFALGTSGAVQISDSNGQASADAVRFVRVNP